MTLYSRFRRKVFTLLIRYVPLAPQSERSEKIHRRLAIAYMFFGWNLFGFVVYKFLNQKSEDGVDPMLQAIMSSAKPGHTTRVIQLSSTGTEIEELKGDDREKLKSKLGSV